MKQCGDEERDARCRDEERDARCRDEEFLKIY